MAAAASQGQSMLRVRSLVFQTGAYFAPRRPARSVTQMLILAPARVLRSTHQDRWPALTPHSMRSGQHPQDWWETQDPIWAHLEHGVGLMGLAIQVRLLVVLN